MTVANVILLRSSAANGPDTYESCFRSEGYFPLSVPVLETALVHIDQLKRIMCQEPTKQGLHGVIITSGRSCEAWRRAVKELLEESLSISTDEEAASVAAWASVPFYVVGQSTASALLDIGITYDTLLAPKEIRGAAESGTSEKLARFILRDLPQGGPPARLLYLTGDKNRDTLPNILLEGGVELESLQVYETRGSDTFGQDLEDAINSAPPDVDKWWIVYFAPSAADFVTPILRAHFDLPLVDNWSLTAGARVPKIASIGPTTATYLRDNLKIYVHVVSPNPKAEDLAAAILAVDQER